MGRETKLLLGLLATLLGVFLGVLSMKLLVPRPPAGTGPDVHAEIAATEPQALVEPPALDQSTPHPRSSLADATAAPTPQDQAAPSSPSATTGPARDPFVIRSAYVPDGPPETDRGAPATHAATTFESSRFDAASERPVRVVDGGPPPVAGSTYVAREGDSWWSLANTVYGDGRLYRALFAWNRTVDPRVSLVPGTSLELPPLHRLQAAWPALMPAP